MKYLTIGGAVQDIFFATQEGQIINNKQDILRQKLVGFEYGAKVNIDELDMQFGGGAGNVSVALAKLGAKVAPLVCLGQDTIGQSIINNFKEHKIDNKNIQYSKQNSGMSAVVVYGKNTKDHILFTYRGANEDLKFDQTKVKKWNPDYIYTSSLSGKNWQQLLDQLINYKQKFSKFWMWNPGNLQITQGVKKLAKYLAVADVLSINKDEAIELLIKAKPDLEAGASARKLATYLAEYCPGIIVITLGKKGSLAHYDGKFYEQPVHKIEKHDTTGGGDAFGATFLWSLDSTNHDIQKSLQLASKNAASVMTQKGAQNGLLTRNKLVRK